MKWVKYRYACVPVFCSGHWEARHRVLGAIVLLDDSDTSYCVCALEVDQVGGGPDTCSLHTRERTSNWWQGLPISISHDSHNSQVFKIFFQLLRDSNWHPTLKLVSPNTTTFLVSWCPHVSLSKWFSPFYYLKLHYSWLCQSIMQFVCMFACSKTCKFQVPWVRTHFIC